MRYENPWADSDGFLYLGDYDIIPYDHKTRLPDIVWYDLYALEPQNIEKYRGKPWILHCVSLGARYSNVDSEYLSGSLDLGWKYGDRYPIYEAARRYVTLMFEEKMK